MEKKASTLFNAISNLPVFKEYIDLRNLEINNTTDLVKIAYTFRNPVYETFRIIYMCDNKIVGYESVTSRMPNVCNIFNFQTYKMNPSDLNKGCLLMVNRMFRLGANGYYLMHNHPSGDAKASRPDIEITRKISEGVKGFLGHVIIDHGTYSWIENEHGRMKVSDSLPINNTTQLKSSSECKGNPLLDQKITCRNDLARLMYDVKHAENYSLLILCNTQNKIRLIQDIPNCFMNMTVDQLAGYIRNQAKLSGSIKAYISTTNIKVFTKACELKQKGALTDTIAYNTVNDIINLLAKDDDNITQDIFSKSRKEVRVTERENLYLSKEESEKKKELAKIVDTKLALMKRMDKEIENANNPKPSQKDIPVPDGLTPLLDALAEKVKENPKQGISFGDFRIEPVTEDEKKMLEEDTQKQVQSTATSQPLDQDTIKKNIIDTINSSLKKYSDKNPSFPKFEISELICTNNQNTDDDTYEDEEE